MRVAFILNPAARDGRAARLGPRLLAAASPHHATVYPTNGPRHAETLARDLSASVDRVVAVGGDGTVGETADGLAGTGTPMGIVPAGTGNDLASALGLRTRLDAAVAVALGDTVQATDLLRARWTDADGTTGERVAANAVGLGFDAAVAAAVSRYKRLGGVAAYLAAVFGTLRDWRRPDRHARIWIDDALVHDGSLFLVSIGNGPRVGGGFMITPNADPSDGVLDVCVISHARTARVLRLLPRAMRGHHLAAAEVAIHRGGSVCVEIEGRPVAVHGDGESVSEDVRELAVEMWRSAIEIARPAARSRQRSK